MGYSAEHLRKRRERQRRLRRVRLVAVLTVVLGAAASASLVLADDRGRTNGEGEAGAAVNERSAELRRARVTVAAAGDIAMGRDGYLPPDGGRTLFDGVDQALRARVVIGNLEGTLTTRGTSKCAPRSPNCFAFRTPPSYARWLRRAGFTVMNLANNHSYDYGSEGAADTAAALAAARIRVTGRPGEVAVQRVGRVRVAVVGFAPYWWAQDLRDLDAAASLVREAGEEADVVVVTMHAGAEGEEFGHVALGPETHLGEDRGDVMAFAHTVIDAGADLVVGHGPHVLRGMEWYRGRLIAYSLGNFAGHRTFRVAGRLTVSGILRATLRGDGSWVRGNLVATRLVGHGTPVLDPAEEAHGVVRALSREDFGAAGIIVTRRGDLVPPRGV